MIYNTRTNIVSLLVRKTQYRSRVRIVIITGLDTNFTNSFSTSSIGFDGKYSLIGKSIATSKTINTKLIILLEFLRIFVKGRSCLSKYIYYRIYIFFKKKRNY